MALKHEQQKIDSLQGGAASAEGTVAALQQTIATLRRALDGSPDMIAAADTAARYLAFNRAYHDEFKKVFGVDLKIGDSMIEALAHLPEEQRAVGELFERTMRGEDFTVIHAFGDERLARRLYEIHCFPLYDTEGRLLGGTHIARDVTEQKKMEEGLRASEERFRRLVESNSVGLGISDLHGKVLYANQALLKLTGYALEDVSRTSWFELTPPEYFALDQQAAAQILATGSCAPYEKEIIAKDGRRIAVIVGFSQIDTDAAGAPVGACFVTDLTRLKHAEAERERLLAEQALACAQLEGERQKLQTILENMPAGVVMADAATGKHILINEQAARLFNTQATPGGYIGKMGHQLFKSDGQPYNYDEYPLVRSMKTGEVVSDEEIRIVCPDGRQLTVLTNSVPIRDPQGRIVAGVALFTDITERKRAEEALRRSEERLSLATEAGRIGYWHWDLERNEVYWSDRCKALFGLPPETGVTYASFVEMLDPEDRARAGEAWMRALAENRDYSNEYRAIWPDGSVHWIQTRGRVEYNPTRDPLRVIGVMIDISDSKNAEASLRLRNERLLLLSEAAAHLLKAQNPDTMILELFEKVSRHLDLQGYMNFMVNEAGDALRLDSYAGIPPEAAQLVQRLEFGQGVCGTVAQCRHPIYVIHIQHSDAEMVQLLKGLGIRAYACNPLMAGGRLLGTLAFATTTRDAFDEDELAFMRAICQYVAMAKERLRLEGELHRHIDHLAEADRLKDEFLAMLAHELRNPLAPIRNAVQVLRLAKVCDESVLQRQREIIDRQVTHMARLLDDLLDVSRITRGKIRFKMQPLALAAVATHALETAAPLIEARRQQMHFDPPPEELRVMADLDRLAQAIGNLLTNAAKYTPEGGKIWLETVREGPEVVIRVRDSGIGIAAEMLPHIFDLFAQADQGLAHSQGGLGIGLTLVRRLVQMHGGSVEARSAGIGQGSEFMIRLPALFAHNPMPPST